MGIVFFYVKNSILKYIIEGREEARKGERERRKGTEGMGRDEKRGEGRKG